MLSASKGDLLFEPLAFVLELLARILGRVAFRSTLDTSSEQWGTLEWTLTIIALSVLLVLVWKIARRASRT